VCDLETSRVGAPYIYDISNLRVKELIFNALLLQMTILLFLTQKTICNRQFIYYIEYPKEYNLEIATKKTKVFGFAGTDHLRTKIIITDETLEQVSQFTYLGCSISYQFSNDVEFKLEKFLQLIGTINHHVQEGLDMIPVPCILKMKLVPPSLPWSSYVSSSFWFIL
jgi:hypothetical protein